MSFKFPRRGRSLGQDQSAELTIIGLDGNQRVIFTADEVIEAPNWTPDGNGRVFNTGGRLFRVAVKGGQPELIDTGDLVDLNNDHGLSPDGSSVYVSSDDGHLYAGPLVGGTSRRVSTNTQPGITTTASGWPWFHTQSAADRVPLASRHKQHTEGA